MKNKNIKILLVDDEPKNIKDLVEALDCDKYELFIAPNGKLAYEQAKVIKPSAIIMDWDMPEMNGLEALKKIRQTTGINNTPIIMATGKMTSVENLKTALEAGANDYIRKPFETMEIMARVNAMINLNCSYSENIQLQRQIAEQQITFLKQKITLNKQQLASSKVRIIQENNRYTELIRRLVRVKKLSNKTIETEIIDLISFLESSQVIVNWSEFEALFESVHPKFFTNLNSQFPELTKNERRICAFIKMEMSLKEIASITQKTTETIRKARYRLKIKLGLESDDLLSRFILNL